MKIKVGFQLRFPHFMADIIRLLLYREEEDLACYLTAFYEIMLQEDIIDRAVKTSKFNWLKYLWAFNQNIFQFNESRMNKNDQEDVKFTFIDLFQRIN